MERRIHVSGAGSVALFLLREVAGSLVLGLAVGWVVYRMLRSVDNFQVEVLLTLALAVGLYALASALKPSGPLAVVVAGMLIGNQGRAHAMSKSYEDELTTAHGKSLSRRLEGGRCH